MQNSLQSFPPGAMAVVVGASGGLGRALVEGIEASAQFDRVLALSRRETGLELTDETSIAAAAAAAREIALPVRLVIVATGLLHDGEMAPEKSLRQLDGAALARSYAVNAIGPALVAKHFLPLLPRQGKAAFVAVSAKVGSIGDNHLGGWYGYRAAKAALNQLTHTAAIELRRTHPEAVCVTVHPGTVETALSAPFRAPGHAAAAPAEAAQRLLGVIDAMRPIDSGLMLDHTGLPLPW